MAPNDILTLADDLRQKWRDLGFTREDIAREFCILLGAPEDQLPPDRRQVDDIDREFYLDTIGG